MNCFSPESDLKTEHHRSHQSYPALWLRIILWKNLSINFFFFVRQLCAKTQYSVQYCATASKLKARSTRGYPSVTRRTLTQLNVSNQHLDSASCWRRTLPSLSLEGEEECIEETSSISWVRWKWARCSGKEGWIKTPLMNRNTSASLGPEPLPLAGCLKGAFTLSEAGNCITSERRWKEKEVEAAF